MSTLAMELGIGMVLLAAALAALAAFFVAKSWPSVSSKTLLVLPLLLAAGMVGLLAIPLEQLVVMKKAREVKAGWNLVPVQVAARDLKGGDVLEAEDLMEQSIPEQLVTASVVKRDSRDKALGRPLLGPVRKGEPMTWLLVGIGVSSEECGKAGR